MTLMPPKIELGIKAKKAQQRLAQKKTSSKRVRQEFVTHRELAGFRFNPGHDIPPIDQIPWNKLNLVSIHKGVTDTTHLKASELANNIINQLDGSQRVFASTAYMDIKISSIRAWAITGSSLAMTIYDWSSNVDVTQATSTEEVLAEIIDNKTDVVPAIGYMVPEALKHVVITNAISKPQMVCSFLATKSSDVMVLINLSWKPNGPQKLLYTGPSILNSLHSIEKSTKSIKKSTSVLDEVRHPQLDALQIAPPYGAETSPLSVQVDNSFTKPIPVVALGEEVKRQGEDILKLTMKLDSVLGILKNLTSIPAINQGLATPDDKSVASSYGEL